MKKNKLLLIIRMVLFLLLIATVPVFAQESPEKPNECCLLSTDVSNVDTECVKGAVVGPKTTADCTLGNITKTTDAWAMCCLVDTVNNITNWIFYFLLIVAVLMILIGGIIFMFAGGDAEKAGKGKSFIIYAIIGVAIGLLAKAIPALVVFIVK